jgi:hypothetical protein
MRQSKRIPESAEKTFRDIRRATRRHHSAEDSGVSQFRRRDIKPLRKPDDR